MDDVGGQCRRKSRRRSWFPSSGVAGSRSRVGSRGRSDERRRFGDLTEVPGVHGSECWSFPRVFSEISEIYEGRDDDDLLEKSWHGWIEYDIIRRPSVLGVFFKPHMTMRFRNLWSQTSCAK